MENDVIKQRLLEKFEAPLSEFYQRKIVFWHDEEHSFGNIIDEIDIPNVKVLKLTGNNNFYAKKLLSMEDTTSNYLVYDPCTYADIKDNWLLDIELYSESFRADLMSMTMDELNVDQNANMRRLMKQYKKFFENKERVAKLKAFDSSYTSAGQFHIDIMAVLAGSTVNTPAGIIRAVLLAGLEENEAIENIEKFGDINAFWSLINKYVGYEHTENDTVLDLASHIFLTALSTTMAESFFKGLEKYVSYGHQATCYSMVNEWIHSEDDRLFFPICVEIENQCELYERFTKVDISDLLDTEIFPCINESILSRFMDQISFNIIKVDEIVQTVEKKRTQKWYHRVEGYFDGLMQAANMQKFYNDHITGFHEANYKDMWKNYENEYYLMDSYYRSFFRAFGLTLKDSNLRIEDSFKGAADYIENLYKNSYLTPLASKWTSLTKDELATGPKLGMLDNQRSFYSSNVAPLLSGGGRVFVIISDAFRYEAAAELKERLTRETKGNAEIKGIQSILPSVTKYGMAALLPHTKYEVVDGKTILCDGASTDGTANRDKILKAKTPESVAITYKDFLAMKQAQKREMAAGKNVIYIYHNVIDATGEVGVTEDKIFEACEEAIDEIFNLVKTISNELSGTNILITSDHGFLYSYKKLQTSDKAEKDYVAGTLFETDRRYIITDKADDSKHVIKVPMSDYGCDFFIMIPQDIIRFKTGGGMNYVHGGATLQEMMVPVITFKNVRATSKKFVENTKATIELTSSSRKVSNSIFTLNFYQKEPIGGKVSKADYEVYMSDASGNAVSDRQTIIADKTSENGSDRMFHIRLTLKGQEFKKTDTYYLTIIEKGTANVIDRIEYTIDIAFANDFDF